MSILTKATPRPWVKFDDTIHTCIITQRVKIGGTNITVSDEEIEANTDLIFRAVNCHDDFIAELKKEIYLLSIQVFTSKADEENLARKKALLKRAQPVTAMQAVESMIDHEELNKRSRFKNENFSKTIWRRNAKG